MSPAAFFKRLISSRMYAIKNGRTNQERSGTQELGDPVREAEKESPGAWRKKIPE